MEEKTNFTAGKIWNSILLGIIIIGLFAIRYIVDFDNSQLQAKDKEISELKRELNQAKIKGYILDEITLTDEELSSLDINGDGKVSSLDYVLLKNGE